MKTSEQVIRINDVEYELAARNEFTGFHGSWFCRKCWQGSVKYERLPTVDDAMSQAEKGAIHHHKAAHGKNITIVTLET